MDDRDIPIHLICGLTGAGKTTYARGLAEAVGGHVFSIDDWLRDLYLMDADVTADWNWFRDRVRRIGERMRAEAYPMIMRGWPVVFDCGFTNREERCIYLDWIRGVDVPSRMHVLEVDADIRWARVEARNAEMGATFTMKVTRSMFDHLNQMWEAPGDDEMIAFNGVRV